MEFEVLEESKTIVGLPFASNVCYFPNSWRFVVVSTYDQCLGFRVSDIMVPRAYLMSVQCSHEPESFVETSLD